MAPKAKQEAKFDWWHPPGSWGKLVPLRCRLLKGVHLDLSNSATKTATKAEQLIFCQVPDALEKTL